MENTKEVFIDIDLPWFNNNYQVSNLGRVYNKKLDRFLKGELDRYYRVTFSYPGGKKKFSIHRLVAKAFLPNPTNKPEVNHKNGIKTDNRAENLEWVTHHENMNHAWRNNLMKPVSAEKSHFSKITPTELHEGLSKFKLGELNRRGLSEFWGLSYNHACDILRKKYWKDEQDTGD